MATLIGMQDISKHFIDSVTRRTAGTLDYALREAGPADGAPILLLHGLLDTGASFAPLVHEIEAHQPGQYRFIAPDWRGHGDSDSVDGSYWFPEYIADLQMLIDDILPTPDADDDSNDDSIIMMGHSMGGQAASLFAGLRPERVSHLITLDSLNVPDTRAQDVPARYRRWLDARRQPPEPGVYTSVDTIAERIRARYTELDAQQCLTLATEWSRPVDEAGARRMHFDPWHRIPSPYGFRADEAKAIWREVTALVLCIDAGNSPAQEYMDAAEMAHRRACFQDVRHRVISECGHMLHLQKPDSVAEHVCEFLARTRSD